MYPDSNPKPPGPKPTISHELSSRKIVTIYFQLVYRWFLYHQFSREFRWPTDPIGCVGIVRMRILWWNPTRDVQRKGFPLQSYSGIGFKGKVGNIFSNMCSSCLGNKTNINNPWLALLKGERSSVLFCRAEKGLFPRPWLVERKSLFVKKSLQKLRRPYWDDISGKPLDPSGVKEARKEEVQVINEMGVWEVIPRPVGEKVISTRWVDINKGDEGHPKYPSWFVARETPWFSSRWPC